MCFSGSAARWTSLAASIRDYTTCCTSRPFATGPSGGVSEWSDLGEVEFRPAPRNRPTTASSASNALAEPFFLVGFLRDDRSKSAIRLLPKRDTSQVEGNGGLNPPHGARICTLASVAWLNSTPSGQSTCPQLLVRSLVLNA